MTEHTSPTNESKLILTAGLIQFVNVTDFVMVMPLGPDFAQALNIPTSQIGTVGGIYAFAAALAGLIGSFFLDNYARKRAILFFLTGLSVATLLCAFAWNFHSMLAVRFLAGLFGGPLTTLSIAIIADYIPPERRGAAMGKVMGAFSAASVIGIPFGLQLAQWVSWHAPFVVTSLLCVGALVYGIFNLPYRAPFARQHSIAVHIRAIAQLLRTRIVSLSYTLVICSMMAAFVIIPNFSAHLQYDLGYPRAHLGWLYFLGGIISFFTMRWTGRWVDKTNATHVSLYATILFVSVILGGFVFYPNPLPVTLVFVGFMLAMTTRNICGQALFSKIPPPGLRAAYMSLQTALTHLIQAVAAWVSSLILIEQDHHLVNIATLGWVAIAFSIPVPILFYWIEKHLKKAY